MAEVARAPEGPEGSGATHRRSATLQIHVVDAC